MNRYLLLLGLFFLLVSPTLAQRWVRTTPGRIPALARAGGYEANRTPIYIARANYAGGQHIGKIRNGDRAAAISYGGQELWVADYEVFIGIGRWVEVRAGEVLPLGAILGAVERNGAQQYIARAAIDRGVHPGKAIGRAVWIPYGGREVSPTSFSVLIDD
jgi:hypothetical protein